MLLFQSPPPSPVGLCVGQSVRSSYSFSLSPPALCIGDTKRTTTMGSRQPTITTGLLMSQVHTIAGSVNTAVKNVTEAKSFLASKGWIALEEPASADVLVKVLFAAMVHAPKLPPVMSATIASVAYLLTEKQEEGLLEKSTDSISLHIKDTLDSITSDMHVKLDQHIQQVAETAQAQTVLTEKLVKAQEQMDEMTQKIITTTRMYSQVAATTPTHIPTLAPTPSINQIRLHNREEIKKRQVLIEFDNTELQLKNMSDTVLGRKAKDTIATAWAIAPEPKPTLPGVKATVLLRNGGLLLKMDSAEAAEWLCDDANRTSVLNNIGSGVSIKNQTYQVIVQFIPVTFEADNNISLRNFETINGLEAGSMLKAEWIKPIKDRRENQRVATARFYFWDAKSADTILSRGAYISGKKVVLKKPRKEPIRCLKCQLLGHERRHCTSGEARCARCAMNHETETCRAPERAFLCSNCEDRHPSYDRDCPRFMAKCAQLNVRCPENNLAFYPTDNPWLWATVDSTPDDEPQCRERWEIQPPGPGWQVRSGANDTPIGPYAPRDQQPQLDLPQ